MSSELRSVAIDAVEVNGDIIDAEKWLARLAHEYLMAHPADDDTPIDLAWLVSSGFTTSLTDVWITRDDRATSITLAARIPCNGEWYFRIESRNNIEHETVETVYFPRSYRTRGDVRMLCKAIGVKLKEQQGQ